MNAYQQKWIDVLNAAGLHEWKIEPLNDDILVELPRVTDVKLVRDNLPEVLGSLSLDIDTPKERLKFIFKNGYEVFDYIINPTREDMEERIEPSS